MTRRSAGSLEGWAVARHDESAETGSALLRSRPANRGTTGRHSAPWPGTRHHVPALGEEEGWCLRLPVTRFGIEAGIPGFLLPGRELLDPQARLPPNTGIALASP